MSDTIKKIGIRQSDGTFLEKEIGADANNIDGLSDLLATKQDVLTEGDNISISTSGGSSTISVSGIPNERKTPSAQGQDLSLVTTGDMDRWDSKADAGTTLSDYNIGNAYTKDEADALFMIQPIIKTVQLAAGNSVADFSGIPTTGDYLANVYTSNGIDYISMDFSTSGHIKVTYQPQNVAITVYLKLEEIQL